MTITLTSSLPRAAVKVGEALAPNPRAAAAELAALAGLPKEDNPSLTFHEDLTSSQCLEETRRDDLHTFHVAMDTAITGKPQPIQETKVRLTLAHKLEKQDAVEYRFIHQATDGREIRAHGTKSLNFEFFMYLLTSEDREYILLSHEKLTAHEQKMRGMALHSASATEVSKRFSLRGFVNIFIVGETISTVRILPRAELLSLFEGWTEGDFLNYLFYHSVDERTYQQPADYSRLLACVLFSGKVEGYPLHLLTMGPPGSGKTKKQESLDQKFTESPGIFEGAVSRLKGLIPSFKERPAAPGYILSCNRVSLIDELLKMIESSMNEGHSSPSSAGNILQQLNPLLEHKTRLAASGNDNSFKMTPTARVIADCNALSGKCTLPEHLGVIDPSTLSRSLVWVVDGVHYDELLTKKEHIGNHLSPGGTREHLDVYTFLSVHDTLVNFLCKISPSEVLRVFKGTTATIRDPRLLPLWTARGLHHTHLIIDGVCKLRCLFTDHTADFVAIPQDYDAAQALIVRMLQTWQSPIGGAYR